MKKAQDRVVLWVIVDGHICICTGYTFLEELKANKKTKDSSLTKATVFCVLCIACSIRTLEYNRFATNVSFCM